MTPREVYAAIDAENWRRKTDFEVQHREFMMLAWHTAMLERQERLPKLADFLDPPRTKVLTPEEAEAHKKDFKKMVNALPKRLRESIPQSHD